MTSLYPCAIQLIERAIQGHVEGFSFAIFPGHEEQWPRLGRHFSLQKEGSVTIIYPWFGIFESAIGPIVYIGFCGYPGWCEQVYEKALSEEISSGITYRLSYRDYLRKELCFPLKTEDLDWLRSPTFSKKNEELILDFFKEVLTHVGKFLG